MQSKRFEIFLVLITIFYFLFVGFVVFSIFSEKFRLINKSENFTRGIFLKNFEENLVKNENIFFIEGDAGEENNVSNLRRACSVEASGKFLSCLNQNFIK